MKTAIIALIILIAVAISLIAYAPHTVRLFQEGYPAATWPAKPKPFFIYHNDIRKLAWYAPAARFNSFSAIKSLVGAFILKAVSETKSPKVITPTTPVMTSSIAKENHYRANLHISWDKEGRQYICYRNKT